MGREKRVRKDDRSRNRTSDKVRRLEDEGVSEVKELVENYRQS